MCSSPSRLSVDLTLVAQIPTLACWSNKTGFTFGGVGGGKVAAAWRFPGEKSDFRVLKNVIMRLTS